MAGGSRFRLPYKKRKYYHRSNYNSMSTEHITSLINPFDNTNGMPKWPDGQATYSIGRRHQLTSEIYADHFYVLLFPGQINWCVAFEYNETEPNSPYLYANHTANISINYEYNGDKTTGVFRLEIAHDAFNSWRNVATAVHLQVINTTDSNEGWYRAVRMNRPREWNEIFNVIMGPGSAYGNGNHIMETPHLHTGGCIPNENFFDFIETYFQDNPTFCTGELQDIHNAVFQLNESKQINNFKTLETVHMFARNTQTGVGTPTFQIYDVFKRDDRVDSGQFFSVRQDQIDVTLPNTRYNASSYGMSIDQWSLVSECKDMILLEVFGTKKTKVLLHSVNNQEFLVGDNSQLAQYNTACHANLPALRSYNQTRNNFHKLPYHYLTSVESTGKAVPAPFYASEPYHYYG